MEDLVKTDLGLISRENANWLFMGRVLNRKGNILNNRVQGLSDKSVGLLSYLLWAVEDAKRTCPTLPDRVHLCLNDYLTLLRTGELKKPYTYEGQEFCYAVSHSVVDNIERSGKEAFVKYQPESKTKKWDDSIFDN